MLLAYWDGFVCGQRPNVDLDKLKKSREHYWDWDLGWCCTALEGGRSKLCGIKKGTRPWSSWLVCMCQGGKHRRPIKHAWSFIDEDGNPTKDLGFDPCCPPAVQEFVFQWLTANQQELRKYPNFWPRSGRDSNNYELELVLDIGS